MGRWNDLELRKRYASLESQLANARSSWEAPWRTIADYIVPDRSRFLGQMPNDGQRLNDKIIDATATEDLDTCAAGMMSQLTDPTRDWFLLRTPDPDLNEYQPVKDYLAKSVMGLRDILVGSNIYNALPVAYGDLAGFGMFAGLLDADDEDVIRAYPWPVGQYAFATNRRGVVDGVTRRFAMTARQLVEQFGIDEVSDQAKREYNDGKASTWFDVVHVITQNVRHDPAKLSKLTKRYSSCYFEPASGDAASFLSMGGYDDFPVLCPRWQVRGEDAYGRNYPGLKALGDVKMLQKLHADKLAGLEQMVRPTMNADPALRGHRLSLVPADVNFLPKNSQGVGFTRAFEITLPLNDIRQEILEVQARIGQRFYADLFLALTNMDRQMTAHEVAARHEEKLQSLGPVVNRLDGELYKPLIDRAWNLAVARGLMPKPPPEIEGMKLKIEYQSVLRQAMRAAGVSTLDRFVGTVGQMAAYAPEALDAVDTDAVVAEYGNLYSVPSKILRAPEAVAARRKERQQQLAAQQAAAMAASAAGTAKDLAAAPTSGDNALTRALGIPAEVA